MGLKFLMSTLARRPFLRINWISTLALCLFTGLHASASYNGYRPFSGKHFTFIRTGVLSFCEKINMWFSSFINVVCLLYFVTHLEPCLRVCNSIRDTTCTVATMRILRDFELFYCIHDPSRLALKYKHLWKRNRYDSICRYRLHVVMKILLDSGWFLIRVHSYSRSIRTTLNLDVVITPTNCLGALWNARS